MGETPVPTGVTRNGLILSNIPCRRYSDESESDTPIRIIVDGDPVSGETIEPGSEMVVDGELVEIHDLQPGEVAPEDDE
jgi:hypothetical protein